MGKEGLTGPVVSDSFETSTAAVPPLPPGALTVTLMGSSVELNWPLPLDRGGLPLTNTLCYHSLRGSEKCVKGVCEEVQGRKSRVGEMGNCTVVLLGLFGEYKARALATNLLGSSEGKTIRLHLARIVLVV